jgi:hypothetical protein
MADSANAILKCLGVPSINVKIKAAWSLGNLCDALVINKWVLHYSQTCEIRTPLEEASCPYFRGILISISTENSSFGLVVVLFSQVSLYYCHVSTLDIILWEVQL